jgi:transcriptional regulator with XRE-family HTH domain
MSVSTSETVAAAAPDPAIGRPRRLATPSMSAQAANRVAYLHAREARRNGLIPGATLPASAVTSRITRRPRHVAASDTAEPATTDATGTRRRLQALALNGWTASALARYLGADAHSLRQITSGTRETVTASTAIAVGHLYDQLWNRFPKQDTAAAQKEAAAVRALARHAGWAPALAWDDDRIDDQQAVPQGTATAPASRYGRVARLVDASEELLAWGYTLRQAAERLGVSRNSLEQARLRRGLHLTRRQRAAAPGATPGLSRTSVSARGTGPRDRRFALEAAG